MLHIDDCLYFIWEGHYTGVSDAVAQEIKRAASKLAFSNIDNKSVPLESLKQQSDVLFVCFGVLTRYEYVINVDKCELEVMTDSVHQSLESLGSIS